jgi:hypothetical protein
VPTDEPHATIDGKAVPVERVTATPRRARSLVALAPDALRKIEWKSFLAGAGVVAVGSAVTWIGSWWWRGRRHRKRA